MQQFWIFALLASILLGFSKAGFKGLGFIIVPLMAYAFGGKASTGILLPLLIIGDALAVYHYRKDVNWKVLMQLFLPMSIGVILGVYVGDQIPVDFFKQVLACMIICSGFMIIWLNQQPKDNIPNSRFFAMLMGLGAGFCTMVGNLAGAFMNIYFLAMRFPKREFIGTTAWLIFFINLFKMPFHIWVWQTISWQTFSSNIILIPFVILGLFIGLFLIDKVSNTFFNRYVLIMTFLGAILLLI